ncbi:CRE-SRX-134 protein [Caenorhabditis remanei]|uniref:CRE-SRX-134 protein n=1 Tax=Caenorhabditis remanei TaxID=31234 RepID=E3M0G6_CAERE|nr:CRE-SRX-134 protein [Caenorhabditis remanei]
MILSFVITLFIVSLFSFYQRNHSNFQVGLIGVFFNSILILKLMTANKKLMNSFHMLCFFKAIPNLIISASFPFWICPLTFLDYKVDSIPRSLNVFVAEFVGLFCYYLAPLILICISLNRFAALYFPFSKSSSYQFRYTKLLTFGCFVLASGPVWIPKFFDCYFIYDPELGIFMSENVEKCGRIMDSFVVYSIFILAFTSNGFNLMICAKLVKDKMTGISEDQKLKRRKKWQSMYIQSVIQDFLPVIDLLNFNIISGSVDSPLWYFIFSTFSFVFIYALDGAVIIYFYSNSRVCCFHKSSQKKTSTFISGVQSTA